MNRQEISPTEGICTCQAKAAVCGRCLYCGRLKEDEMAKRATAKPVDVLNVPVAFGGISIGDSTAKVAFSIDREALNIDVADGVLCGKRLTGRLVVTKGGDDPDQQALPNMGDIKHEIGGSFDVKGFRVSPKLIASGAVFLLSGIQVEELGHFAKKAGRLIVSEVAEASDGGGEECDDE